MSDAKDARVQIDNENVKSLILINGGASVALLAFLPEVIKYRCFIELSMMILRALVVYQFGITCAILHNYLRRKCSKAYDDAKSGTGDGCKKLSDADFPVCQFSWVFMYLSYISFSIGSILVFCGGWESVSAFAQNDCPN